MIDLRERSLEPEILDDPAVPDHVRERCYLDLERTHHWLGNHRLLIRRIASDPEPVSRVLDIGCGHGNLLREVRRKLHVDVIGVDLVPPARVTDVPIRRADAVRDPLPDADIALSVIMAHHLSPAEVQSLIRNAGRSCRRLLLLDLVRHPVPLALFRAFIAPFVNPINVSDGIRSLERAYKPNELADIVRDALSGTGATFRHEVALFKIRQFVDIRFQPHSGSTSARE